MSELCSSRRIETKSRKLAVVKLNVMYHPQSPVNNDVDKTPADPAARVDSGSGRPQNVMNTKICCGFFRNGFLSSVRRHYSIYPL